MAVRRDKQKGYYVVQFTFKHADGRKERVYKKSPVQTKNGAVQFEFALRQELLERDSRKEVSITEVPTVSKFSEEFVKVYAKTNNKPSEVTSKQSILRCCIIPFFGDMRLDQITLKHIERFKAHQLSNGLSPKTINNQLVVLRKMLVVAQEWEIIKDVPRVKWLRCPKPKTDFLTFQELEILLRVAKQINPEWYAMIYFAAKTGLRYGELCELRWSDVDLHSGRLVVRRSFTKGHVGTPKNGLEREVPLSPVTVSLLRSHRHLRGELVFCKPDGGRHTHHRADVALRRICKRANLRPIGWHVLRHTFASHLAMHGRTLKEIQELLGHSDYGQTLRYAHLCAAVRREAVATLDQQPVSNPSIDPPQQSETTASF